MPNIGLIVVILFIALLVMGPEKAIPFARSMGRFIRGFRNYTQNITSDIAKSFDLEGGDTPTSGLKDLAQGLRSDIEKIMSSVDQDVGDVRNSIQAQNKQIVDSLAKDSQELKGVLANEIQAIAQTVGSSTQELKETVESQINETTKTVQTLDTSISESVKENIADPMSNLITERDGQNQLS
jgi:Sec-independent protein translocase protein TatA